jgi:hypothetical protein
MFNLLIGLIIGAIFSPILIKLFKIGWEKLNKTVDKIQ